MTPIKVRWTTMTRWDHEAPPTYHPHEGLLVGFASVEGGLQGIVAEGTGFRPVWLDRLVIPPKEDDEV